MAPRTIDRGDIIHLDFSPASGHELNGKHFGFVVSTKEFNATGLALVCPISQGQANSARTAGFLVSLMCTGLDTQGSIHCHQIKSLDLKSRCAVVKEKAPKFIVDEVLDRVSTLLS